MNQIEQSISPIKALTTAPTVEKVVRPRAKSLNEMLLMARETAHTEDFVWGILSATTLVILLVSVWI